MIIRQSFASLPGRNVTHISRVRLAENALKVKKCWCRPISESANPPATCGSNKSADESRRTSYRHNLSLSNSDAESRGTFREPSGSSMPPRVVRPDQDLVTACKTYLQALLGSDSSIDIIQSQIDTIVAHASTVGDRKRAYNLTEQNRGPGAQQRLDISTSVHRFAHDPVPKDGHQLTEGSDRSENLFWHLEDVDGSAPASTSDSTELVQRTEERLQAADQKQSVMVFTDVRRLAVDTVSALDLDAEVTEESEEDLDTLMKEVEGSQTRSIHDHETTTVILTEDGCDWMLSAGKLDEDAQPQMLKVAKSIWACRSGKHMSV